MELLSCGSSSEELSIVGERERKLAIITRQKTIVAPQ